MCSSFTKAFDAIKEFLQIRRLDKAGTGIWIRPKLDLGIFHQVFVHDEYEFDMEDDPAVIIDAGANIGCATLYFAHRFPNARIFSIEPNPVTFELLERNVSCLNRVQTIEAALWFEDSEIEIVDESVHHLAVQVQKASHSPEKSRVAGITVAHIMALADCTSVDLLKLDIEGAEDDVFERAGEWLGAVKCIVIEFHEQIRPGSEGRIRQKISGSWAYREICRGENVAITRL